MSDLLIVKEECPFCNQEEAFFIKKEGFLSSVFCSLLKKQSVEIKNLLFYMSELVLSLIHDSSDCNNVTVSSIVRNFDTVFCIACMDDFVVAHVDCNVSGITD